MLKYILNYLLILIYIMLVLNTILLYAFNFNSFVYVILLWWSGFLLYFILYCYKLFFKYILLYI